MHHHIHWGIAPIGWRNDDFPEIGKENTISHLLSDIVVAGFEGTEVGRFFPEARIFNKELYLRKLRIAAQWFSSFIIRDGIERTSKSFHQKCQYLREVDADCIVISEQTDSIQSMNKNVFTEKSNFTHEEWQLLCNGLNDLGKIADQYGLKLVYHHHMGTGVQILAEINQLMSNTDPKHVHLLYDTGHIYVSDGDCMGILRKHVDRIQHVHFKDIRKSALDESIRMGRSFIDSFLAGLFTVPGDGDIDFSEIYFLLLEAGYKGWIIIEAEQDPAKAHPLEYALIAKKYIDNQLLNKY